MLLSLNLAYEYFLPAEPVYILFQSARHRVDRTQTILNLIRSRLRLDIMLLGIFCQMVKSHVIAHITFVFGIADLVLLGNTGTDKGRGVLPAAP